MQKLSGTSSGKNNKSCRIFHIESNKIGFSFFWFFYVFLRILQDSAKQQHYWRFTFATRPLTGFPDSQICPWFPKTPWKLFWFLAMSPLAQRVTRLAGIPASRRRPRPGKWRRRARGSPRTQLRVALGRGGRRQGARRRSRVACAWSSAPPRWGPGRKSRGVW
jgi:hypothetical protein